MDRVDILTQHLRIVRRLRRVMMEELEERYESESEFYRRRRVQRKVREFA
jgi:hypothetical protein